jgi:hypothetical protein
MPFPIHVDSYAHLHVPLVATVPHGGGTRPFSASTRGRLYFTLKEEAVQRSQHTARKKWASLKENITRVHKTLHAEL